MKKILLLSAMVGGMVTGAQAQHLPNGTFENWKGENKCGNTIQASTDMGGQTNKGTAKQRPGNEPSDWNGSSVKQKVLMEKSEVLIFQKNDANHGNYANLTNKYVGVPGVAGANAPAYITFGTPWVYATASNTKQDGGTFGGMAFSHKPDAITGEFRRIAGSEKPTEEARIIVYLWQGTFTSNIGIAGGGKITENNVDRAILGKSNAGTVTGDGKLIASCDHAFSTTKNKDWETITVPIKYKDGTATPTMMNVIISSADYWTRGNIGKENQLDVDNVRFVYYSELKSFTLNGQAIAIPAAGATTDCSQLTYDEAQAAFTSNGQGATIEKAYDEASALLTVTVKGNDWSNENKNEHVYKFQFKKAAAAPATLTAVSIAGENFADFKSDTYTYTLPLVYNPGYVIKGTAAEGCTVKGEGDLAVGDNATKTFKLEVENSEQKVTTYTFNFTDAVAAAESGEYKGGLSVLLTALDDATTATPLANTTIALSKNSNNTYNLALNNFSFAGMPVGDIFVPNVALQNNKLEATRTIVMTSSTPGAMGNSLGALPVKVSVDLLNTTDKKAAASIDIILDGSFLAMMFKGIHVDFTAYTVDEKEPLTDDWGGRAYYPFIKAEGLVTKNTAKFLQLNNHYVDQDGKEHNLPMTYIDLTKADVADDVTLADIMAGAPQANNTLVYLPAGSKITGDNVIVDGQVASLKLTDAQPFNAPTAFTATTVNYDRAFSTEANYISSFVLPYSMNVSDVQGEVYEFASVEANTINFKKATTVEANKPYLIVATAANPFKATNVKVEATPAAMETVNGDYAHVGTYTKQEVTSDATTTYYGYANGQFVKANTGTLNPFRTMIKATNTAAPATLSLKLDGEVTGIVGVNSELGKVNVYNLEGKLVRSQVAAATALQGLAKGVYVINGKKVVK